MQNKGVKSVFKYGKSGFLIGHFPILDSNHTIIGHYIKRLYENFGCNSVRVVVDNKVFEMHMDKYNNVIFRCYEK